MNSSQDGIILTKDSVLPCLCVGHGNVHEIAEKLEPMILGYTRDRKGNVTRRHLNELANTLHTGGGNTAQYAAIPSDTRLADSDFDRYRIYNPNNVCPTIKTAAAANSEPKILVPITNMLSDMEDVVIEDSDGKGYIIKDGWIWRLRKLTEREVYRLQDVNESDIDKLLDIGISKNKHYCLAGNSITISPIYHMLRKLFIDKNNESQQMTIFDI